MSFHSRYVLLFILTLFGYSYTAVDFQQFPAGNVTFAHNMCKVYGFVLLPDQTHTKFVDQILPHMSIGEFSWINAKLVSKAYPAKDINSQVRYAYIKISLHPAEDSLTGYCCHRGSDKKKSKTRCYTNHMTWDGALQQCKMAQCTLLPLNDALGVKSLISMLQQDEKYWVNKFDSRIIPEMASKAQGMTETCVGIVKQSDDTYDYMVDNCNERHTFFCDKSTTEYGAAIQKLSTEPASYNTTNMTIDTFIFHTTQPQQHDTNNLPSILGGTGGALFLLLLFIVIFTCFVYRKKSQVDYVRSLNRYRNRQATSRRELISRREVSHCKENENDQKCEMRHKETGNQDPVEYEDCEQEKYPYVALQQDVVRDISSKRGIEYDNTRDQSSQRLPSYLSMDDVHNKLVPYETYDPDESVNQQRQHQQNQYTPGPKYNNGRQAVMLPPDMEQYENHDTNGSTRPNGVANIDDLDAYENYATSNKMPKLPKKTKKAQNLDDLDAYENYGVPASNNAAATDTNIKRLEDQEQYENYSVPKSSQVGKKKLGAFSRFMQRKSHADVIGQYETPVSSGQNKKNDPKVLDDLDDYENYQVTSKR